MERISPSLHSLVSLFLYHYDALVSIEIHHEYKFALLDLSVEFLDESSQQPINRQSNAMNPACHASSVSV
jgi:hypothetical protein